MKRFFDLVAASGLLILFAPLLLGLTVATRLILGQPALFRQERPGLHGRPFSLIKFRTMTDQRDATGNLLPDAVRLTPFGAFLRRASLDELPELVNVLKGEMSLVGPRPLLMRYLPHYSPREQLRHSVRPGITGWAQIHGRNCLPWDQRLELDVWYVEHQSLWLDLQILARTVGKVLSREGVAANPDEVETDLDQERLGLSCREGGR